MRRRTERAFDFAPLLLKPAEQRGRLVALTGVARRAVRILVNDPDIQKRFGITHYYVVDVFVQLEEPIHFGKGTKDDAAVVFHNTYPITFCVRRLPKGMPEGDKIEETVRIPGFYLKQWAYWTEFVSAQDAEQMQISPMLIGLEPQWVRPQRQFSSWAGMLLAGLFVVSLAGIWIGLWLYSREDARFRRTTLARQFEVPEGQSLNEQNIEASDGPDFSGIS